MLRCRPLSQRARELPRASLLSFGPSHLPPSSTASSSSSPSSFLSLCSLSSSPSSSSHSALFRLLFLSSFLFSPSTSPPFVFSSSSSSSSSASTSCRPMQNDDQGDLCKKNHKGRAVPPSAPREELGLYWGYQTRLASGMADVLAGCPYKGG